MGYKKNIGLGLGLGSIFNLGAYSKPNPFFVNGEIPAFLNEYSYLFDGVDEYLNFGTVAALEFPTTQAFSISVWVKTDDTGDFGIYSNWGISKDGLRLDLDNGRPRFIFDNADGRLFITSNLGEKVNNNVWTHVVFTYNGSTNASGCNIYIDGVSVGFTTFSNTLTATAPVYQPFKIGIVTTSLNLFKGNIDETAVYNKELSSGEVGQIYNAGTPLDLATLGSYSNCVFWHRADNDTWGAANSRFNVIDEISANNGVSVNVEEADRELDTP